jgi:hypothetical protein
MDTTIAMAFQFTRSFLRITQKQYANPAHEVNNQNGNFAEGAGNRQTPLREDEWPPKPFSVKIVMRV